MRVAVVLAVALLSADTVAAEAWKAPPWLNPALASIKSRKAPKGGECDRDESSLACHGGAYGFVTTLMLHKPKDAWAIWLDSVTIQPTELGPPGAVQLVASDERKTPVGSVTYSCYKITAGPLAHTYAAVIQNSVNGGKLGIQIENWAFTANTSRLSWVAKYNLSPP